MSSKSWPRLLAALAGCVGFCALPTSASPGVAEDAITFAQTACFSGPNKHLGERYRHGILAAFRELNHAGGVHGRRLALVAKDDGYEPERAAANVQQLVADNNVLGLIGGVGTATSRRIAPILRAAGIPFVGMLTGADMLRDARRYPNVVHLRASYADEVDRVVAHMVEQRGKRRFGIIHQDDAFGRGVLMHLKRALATHGLSILAKSTFSRNTHAIHSSVFVLAKADLDAVFVVGPASAGAEIINLVHSMDQEYLIATISFASASVLRERVESSRARVLVSAVMIDPADPVSTLARRFRAAIAAANQTAHGLSSKTDPTDRFDSVALEGYVLGRFVADVLQRTPPATLSRASFLATALASELVMVDDWPIRFAPGSTVGARYVRLSDLAGSMTPQIWPAHTATAPTLVVHGMRLD